MFDFSFFELFIVSLIVLIVVGPDRLPTMVRTLGLWVGRARAIATSVRSEFEREVNATGVRDAERSLRHELRDADEEVRGVVPSDEARTDRHSGEERRQRGSPEEPSDTEDADDERAPSSPRTPSDDQ